MDPVNLNFDILALRFFFRKLKNKNIEFGISEEHKYQFLISIFSHLKIYNNIQIFYFDTEYNANLIKLKNIFNTLDIIVIRENNLDNITHIINNFFDLKIPSIFIIDSLWSLLIDEKNVFSNIRKLKCLFNNNSAYLFGINYPVSYNKTYLEYRLKSLFDIRVIINVENNNINIKTIKNTTSFVFPLFITKIINKRKRFFIYER